MTRFRGLRRYRLLIALALTVSVWLAWLLLRDHWLLAERDRMIREAHARNQVVYLSDLRALRPTEPSSAPILFKALLRVGYELKSTSISGATLERLYPGTVVASEQVGQNLLTNEMRTISEDLQLGASSRYESVISNNRDIFDVVDEANRRPFGSLFQNFDGRPDDIQFPAESNARELGRFIMLDFLNAVDRREYPRAVQALLQSWRLGQLLSQEPFEPAFKIKGIIDNQTVRALSLLLGRYHPSVDEYRAIDQALERLMLESSAKVVARGELATWMLALEHPIESENIYYLITREDLRESPSFWRSIRIELRKLYAMNQFNTHGRLKKQVEHLKVFHRFPECIDRFDRLQTSNSMNCLKPTHRHLDLSV